MKRKLFLPVLMIAGLLLLAGCEIRADLVIAEDGSGTFVYSIAIENEYLEMFGQGGRDLLDEMEAKAQTTPFPVTTSRFETEDMRGVEISYDFDSIEDLEEKMASGEGSEGALITEARITNTEAGWTFEALGGQETGSGDIPLDPAELAEIMDIRLSVTLPGPSPAGNADRTQVVGDSARFTWNIPPGKSNLALEASTNYPVGESGLVGAASGDELSNGTRGAAWVAVVTLCAAVAALTAFTTMWRRRSGETAG